MAQLPVPPHRSRLPDPPLDDPYQRELVAAVQRELDLRTPTLAARTEVLLLAPDGVTWALSVGSDGSLKTAVRSGGSGRLP